MEDFSIRAIVIGVSLFVTMFTLTAILIYFNTARSIADSVNKRTDIASSYDYIMNSNNDTDTLTGVEVRSLINRYAGVEHVKINIELKTNDKTVKYANVNNRYVNEDGWLINLNENANLISEEKLDNVNPVRNYNVEKVEKSGQITLNIALNAEE